MKNMGRSITDYKKTAEQYETLFRNVLRDMRQRSPFCPRDFNPDESIDNLVEKYSTGNRYGKFTITDFSIGPTKEGLVELAEREALIDVEDVACMSGGGHSFVYEIQENDSVRFKKATNVRMH